ncbi:hypothetical protein AX17_003663 [Amanita inopinata Kibby_2008]|nr:hypothetical protein AX17_003663 [Amanita inopinata Kibby_2008]
MDIYYPEPKHLRPTNAEEAPVLFFFYGGGFTTGDRTLPYPLDILYANIGWYFAQKGIVTIIPDYRLVPEVQFPSPADDVYQAVSWAVENREQITDAGDVPYELNFDSLFLMGHSAGAVHLAAALFMPGLLCGDPETRDRIAGAVLISGAYSARKLDPESPLADVLAQYWGTFEATKKNSPQALLESAPDDMVAIFPEILLVEGEKVPDWLVVAGEDFHEKLVERTGREKEVVTVELSGGGGGGDEHQLDECSLPEIKLESVTKMVAVGHNHVSFNVTLGAGEGEEWAEVIVNWMRNVIDEREIC